MTSTSTVAPPPGDADAGRGPLPHPRDQHHWEPLAPGALGADPSADPDGDGLFDELPPLPLTGPLADALTTARTALDDAQVAACYTTSLGHEQRLQALRHLAAVRHVADATHLRLLASFTPEELRTLGATTLIDLVITHTGASPARAKTETLLAAALTAPPAHPAPPAEQDRLDPDGPDGPDSTAGAAGPAPGSTAGPAAGSSAVALGLLGAAHATGTVSTDIAALAHRTITDLPAKIRRHHGPTADTALTEALPGLNYTQAALVCDVIAHRLDPDRADRGYDPDDLERRRAHLTVHPDGWVDLHGRFDPIVGAAIKAALDHTSKPDPTVAAPLAPPDTGDHTDDGDGDGDGEAAGGQSALPVRDERTAPQRRADALAALIGQGLSNTETRGGEPPRIIVTTTAAQLAGQAGAGQAVCETTGRFLTRAQLLHLACSGVLQAVTMSCDGPRAAVLSLGRAVRLFTASQRRVMLARDGGCVIPGCTAPPGWLEAHHVHEWADGGPTDVDCGVLLCTRHHQLVTLAVWGVRMVGGVPHVRPPRSVDPLRRWVLNPRRALRDSTARRAEQLLLRVDAPEGWREEAPDPPSDREHQAPTAPDIPSTRGTCTC